MPATVLVVEFSPFYRDRIAAAVSAHGALELAGTCGDGRAALTAVKLLDPDVMTLPTWLPRLTGFEVLRTLVREQARTRVVMAATFVDGATVSDALDAGACGFVWKGTEPAVIADVIAGVSRGATVLGPKIRGELQGELRVGAPRAASLLSARETEVLALAGGGSSARETALVLGVSVTTVRTHLERAYAKLDVTDRTAAVAEAIRRGLLA